MRHVVELAAAMIQAIGIGTDAGFDIAGQQWRPFAANIAGQTDPALAAGAGVEREGQAVDIDQSKTPVAAFSLVSGASAKEKLKVHSRKPADGRKKTVDIGLYRVGHVAGASEAELAVGIVIIALEEKSPRQFQPNPFHVGLIDQDAAEIGDRAVIVFLSRGDGAQQKQVFRYLRGLDCQIVQQKLLGIVQPVIPGSAAALPGCR